jgi:ornithine carbamoyltransferase
VIRHVLDVAGLGAGALEEIYALAGRDPAALGRPLDGRGAALIFEKPSNRTRHSTEMAVVQLGGHPVYTRGDEVGLDVREPVEDVARVLAGYHAVLAARVFDHRTLVRMADVSPVPVVNLLSDLAHPLQAVADLLTMRREFGDLRERSVCWVGDYNNVARSLAEACALQGAALRFASPERHAADERELVRLLALGAASAEVYRDPVLAASGSCAVHTDTWTSMGQEAEAAARREEFAGFTVDEAVMAAALPDAVFMHCLPAHRGEEVAAAVIDGPSSRVVPQAHNRLHAARAVLAWSMGVR